LFDWPLFSSSTNERETKTIAMIALGKAARQSTPLIDDCAFLYFGQEKKERKKEEETFFK
jgi:hypothetical protein